MAASKWSVNGASLLAWAVMSAVIGVAINGVTVHALVHFVGVMCITVVLDWMTWRSRQAKR